MSFLRSLYDWASKGRESTKDIGVEIIDESSAPNQYGKTLRPAFDVGRRHVGLQVDGFDTKTPLNQIDESWLRSCSSDYSYSDYTESSEVEEKDNSKGTEKEKGMFKMGGFGSTNFDLLKKKKNNDFEKADKDTENEKKGFGGLNFTKGLTPNDIGTKNWQNEMIKSDENTKKTQSELSIEKKENSAGLSFSVPENTLQKENSDDKNDNKEKKEDKQPFAISFPGLSESKVQDGDNKDNEQSPVTETQKQNTTELTFQTSESSTKKESEQSNSASFKLMDLSAVGKGQSTTQLSVPSIPAFSFGNMQSSSTSTGSNSSFLSKLSTSGGTFNFSTSKTETSPATNPSSQFKFEFNNTSSKPAFAMPLPLSNTSSSNTNTNSVSFAGFS